MSREKPLFTRKGLLSTISPGTILALDLELVATCLGHFQVHLLHAYDHAPATTRAARAHAALEDWETIDLLWFSC